MPKPERILVWEDTPSQNRFGCSGCCWTFPNDRGEAQADHDMGVVNLRFLRHECDANSVIILFP
jgi:hypothetical protein